jgi:hypothetical protein
MSPRWRSRAGLYRFPHRPTGHSSCINRRILKSAILCCWRTSAERPRFYARQELHRQTESRVLPERDATRRSMKETDRRPGRIKPHRSAGTTFLGKMRLRTLNESSPGLSKAWRTLLNAEPVSSNDLWCAFMTNEAAPKFIRDNFFMVPQRSISRALLMKPQRTWTDWVTAFWDFCC